MHVLSCPSVWVLVRGGVPRPAAAVVLGRDAWRARTSLRALFEGAKGLAAAKGAAGLERGGAQGGPSLGRAASLAEWRRFLALARPEHRLLLGATGFLLLSSAVTMMVPFSIGKIIDLVTSGDPNARLGLALAGLGGVFVLGTASNFGRVFLFRWCGERVVNRLRCLLYARMLHQDTGFFDRHRTGDLLSRLSSDVTVVGKSVTSNVSDGLRAVLQTLVGGAMMYLVSPRLCGIIFSVVPPIAILAVLYGRYVKHLSRRTQDALAAAIQVAEERLGNIRTVKAFSQEPAEMRNYEHHVAAVLALARREALASASFFSLAGVAANGALLLVLWTAGSMVAKALITVGDLSSFLMYTVYVGASFSGLSSFYSELMKGFGACGRVFDVLDSAPRIALAGGAVPSALRGRIELAGVSFAYPMRPEVRVLDRLSLVIEPGRVMAVVGTSGGGKSTLGALLLRLYDPDEGEILVDDAGPLRGLDLAWWHSQVAIVSQEPVLFAGTLRDNIRYGRPDATPDQIEHAVRQANAHAFIAAFPDGLDTLVGERGIALSGGQKQRIAIARAYLKDPRILILDEATSALDTASEALVQEALGNLLVGGRTVIMIAHRLSTLRRADKIAVLEEGRLKEFGTFDELVALTGGSFYRLVSHQLQAIVQDVANGHPHPNKE